MNLLLEVRSLSIDIPLPAGMLQKTIVITIFQVEMKKVPFRCLLIDIEHSPVVVPGSLPEFGRSTVEKSLQVDLSLDDQIARISSR